MTFLHTLFIPALAAAAIPILLHILSRQRLPLIPFSSLKFLRRLQKRQSRKVHIRQLILLAIRTFAITALVMAFARPAIQSEGATGSAAAVEMVVIIDDAIASSVESRDGLLFKLAAQRAEELFRLAGTNDRISFIMLSNPENSLTLPSGQREIIIDRLNQHQPILVAPRFETAIKKADSLLANSELFNREVYLISSFYSSTWDSFATYDESAKIRRFVIPVGQMEIDNLSIDSIKTKNTILRARKPVELEANFSNHSDADRKGVLVSVYLDNERVAQTEVDIPAASTVAHKINIVPNRSGNLPGWVKYDDFDPLSADNKRFFVLNIPDSIRIMVVAPDIGAKMAVNAAFAGVDSGYAILKWADIRGWETTSFSGFDVIVLAGIYSISGGAANRISEFVSAGGGVVMFQSKEADLANLSRELWNRLGFGGAKGIVSQGRITWSKPDLQHPIFAGMFEKNTTPASPNFTFSVDIAHRQGSYPIISFSDGRPLLIENKIGNGRVLLYSVSLEPQSGDFLYAGIFAPLLFRSTAYVATHSENSDFGWTTGNSYKAILSVQNSQQVQLHLPDNSFKDLPPRPVVGGVEYFLGELNQPGIYDISANTSNLARYAVNVPTYLSELKRADIANLPEPYSEAIILNNRDEDLSKQIYNARFGSEIWKPLAASFLLLLLAESILGRNPKREDE